MGSSKIKTVDMSIIPDEDKKTKSTKVSSTSDTSGTSGTNSRRVKHGRSKRYTSLRGQIDRTKTFKLTKAIELVTKTSYSKFPGTVIADAIVQDSKLNLEVTFPHSTGKTTRVAIATEELLAEIEKGNIDFDILITKPDMMSKIAKFARVLGPRGLMPNPKNKTVTPDPEKRLKELQKGVTAVKTEKKHPLIHIRLGKTDQPAEELEANLKHLIKIIGGKRILKLTLSATMSPGVKVDLTPFQSA